MSPLTLAITVLAVALFGASILLGAWIDGRRQALRRKGLHPVTEPDGTVTAQEFLAKSPSPDAGATPSPKP